VEETCPGIFCDILNLRSLVDDACAHRSRASTFLRTGSCSLDQPRCPCLVMMIGDPPGSRLFRYPVKDHLIRAHVSASFMRSSQVTSKLQPLLRFRLICFHLFHWSLPPHLNGPVLSHFQLYPYARALSRSGRHFTIGYCLCLAVL